MQTILNATPAKVARVFNNAGKQIKYRQRIIDAIIDEYGPLVFHNERQFISLGGEQVNAKGKLIEGTELHHLRSVGLFNKACEHNYISVERDIDVHAKNSKYEGPTWVRGTLRSAWGYYRKQKSFLPAVIHADFCTGIKANKPTIYSILENPAYLPSQRLSHAWNSHRQSVLFIINVLKDNTRVRACGNSLDSRPRRSLERQVRWQMLLTAMNIDLIDSFSYVGRTKASTMQTMIYRLSPL